MRVFGSIIVLVAAAALSGCTSGSTATSTYQASYDHGCHATASGLRCPAREG